MAYRIYHVEGIVLQTKPVGEGDMLLFAYTRELGLVMVQAKSLRLGKSRLRFALQRFSHAHLDIIRGKHGWRLTSARTIDTLRDIFRHPHQRITLAAMTSMLMRLIQGEEPQTELYEEVLRLLQIVRLLESQADCVLFELYIAVRFLSLLGYWEKLEKDVDLYELETELPVLLQALSKERSVLVPRINAALRASHL